MPPTKLGRAPNCHHRPRKRNHASGRTPWSGVSHVDPNAAERTLDIKPVRKNAKGQPVVPLALPFCRAYAQHYGDNGSRLPSDLVVVRAAVRYARQQNLPAWCASALVLCKYGPSVSLMLELLCSRPRSDWRRLNESAEFIVTCAATVRDAHNISMAQNNIEIHYWTKHYNAGYEHLGPTACGAPLCLASWLETPGTRSPILELEPF